MPGPPRPPPRPSRKPPPPPGSERRKFERFDVIAQVEIKSSGEVWIVPVVNVSAGGVLVKFDDGLPDLAHGAAAQVFIDLDMMNLNIPAEVVRIQRGTLRTPPQVAFMWATSDPQMARKLASILDKLRERGQ